MRLLPFLFSFFFIRNRISGDRKQKREREARNWEKRLEFREWLEFFLREILLRAGIFLITLDRNNELQ